MGILFSQTTTEQDKKIMDNFPDPVENGDIDRMAGAHSWYKKLSPKGTPCHIFCARNPQVAYNYDKKEETGKIHWYFWMSNDPADFPWKDPRICKVMKENTVPIYPSIHRDRYHAAPKSKEFLKQQQQLKLACERVWRELHKLGYTVETLNKPIEEFWTIVK